MASPVVLDASALIALMRNEKGAPIVAACVPTALISAVNQAEVLTKLVSAGLSEQDAWWHISEINIESVPFDERLARVAGGLVGVTKPLRLSLGDRACLALAIERGAAVYTTNATWKKLDLGIAVEVIR